MYQITVKFNGQDQLFGPDPDNTNSVNICASIQNYISTLTAVLAAEFPSAEITVADSLGSTTVENWDIDNVSARDLENARLSVGEIIHRHWESWSWVVSA